MTMENPLLTQFNLHQKLYNNVLEGFTDEESNTRLHGDKNINHVKYLAGHLLNSQYGLARIAGMEPDIKWNELFAVMGQSKAQDDFTYPSLDEIKTEWNQMHEDTREGLSKLTEADLASTPPAPFDRVASSKEELWAFINHHQAYHIGQIGILRRGFGKEPMRYD
ncbi:MAG TPA: DinB family protein [Pricia sp.]|nr:DinB family protein [Pricia sp.]